MCRGRRNHVLSWLVAPAVLACTPLVARGADAFIRGDANGDSEVDLSAAFHDFM